MKLQERKKLLFKTLDSLDKKIIKLEAERVKVNDKIYHISLRILRSRYRMPKCTPLHADQVGGYR